MKIEDVASEKIHIGPRFRKDEGDLESLASSIRDMGLLQAPGVQAPAGDGDYNLIFGSRRVRACRDILGWGTIPCAVLSIESIIAGEYAENEFRKQFTPSERQAIAAALEAETPKRPGRRTDLLSPNLRQPSPNWGEVAKTKPKVEGPREITAKRAGFSSVQQYDRATVVVHHGTPDGSLGAAG